MVDQIDYDHRGGIYVNDDELLDEIVFRDQRLTIRKEIKEYFQRYSIRYCLEDSSCNVLVSCESIFKKRDNDSEIDLSFLGSGFEQSIVKYLVRQYSSDIICAENEKKLADLRYLTDEEKKKKAGVKNEI